MHMNVGMIIDSNEIFPVMVVQATHQDILVNEVDPSFSHFPYGINLSGGDGSIAVEVIDEQSYVFPAFPSQGYPILLSVVAPSSTVLPVEVRAHVDIEVPSIPATGQMFAPYIEFALGVYPVAASSTALPIELQTETSLMVDAIGSSLEIFRPAINTANTITPNGPLGGIQVMPVTLHSWSGMLVDAIIDPMVNTFAFAFPVRLGIEVTSPLRIRRPDPANKSFSLVDISPFQHYYLPPAGDLTDDSFINRARTTSIVTGYTPSTESLFTHTYYDAFYIQNPRTLGSSGVHSRDITNIYVGANGGSRYRVMNSTGHEIDVYEAAPFTDDLDTLLRGEGRSSLFGQVDISFLVSPENELMDFNRDGSSPYFDLRNQEFTPSTNPVRVPDLMPGEFHGVYVKITTHFSPDSITPTDYSFLKISYTNQGITPDLSTLDRYPGQSVIVHSGTQQGGTLLPSIFFAFTTGYEELLREIEERKETLYNRYPPYFKHYEDL